jgi:hypothetical protein
LEGSDPAGPVCRFRPVLKACRPSTQPTNLPREPFRMGKRSNAMG